MLFYLLVDIYIILIIKMEARDRHDSIVNWAHSLSQHAAKLFSIPKHGDLSTPTGDDWRIPPLSLDVTIADPTSITYLNRLEDFPGGACRYQRQREVKE